jgi:glycosyltransferase involved in cell wall biosynthesis
MILCVGTIEPRKNAVRVLRAAVLLASEGQRFRLVFAGNPGWLEERFVAELRRRRAEGLDVELRLSVTDAELAALYCASSFTVFCSLAEGFGLPIVESLHFGRPVVTSNRGSMAEIARHGGCLLVDPTSVDEIAQAMRRLLKEPELLDNLSRQASSVRWRGWGEYADELYRFATGQDA